jgi:uncharacterized SAM-binding protein YcdF (DUF218 family)
LWWTLRKRRIVVLAGETEQRPARGLQLVEQGFAPKLLLDVPAAAHIYHEDQMEIARHYLNNSSLAPKLSACPITGLSTREEAHNVLACFVAEQVVPKNILLVTSDYHTRRALAIFRHEMPGVEFSVAAAYDPVTYGPQWWRQREWAKTFSGEIVKFLWWWAVDRWRG